MVSRRCKARAVKVVFAAAGVAGVAWAIACLCRPGPAGVPPEAAPVPQADGQNMTLGDTPLVGELRSTDDARSGPVPAVLFGIGRPEADDAPDLSTPAQAVYSILELLDRGSAEALSQCFCDSVPEANESLYPCCLGPPIELVDAVEEGDAATVLWTATVHTGFSLDGRNRSPGETVTLTTRLARVEGLWKLLKLCNGGDEHEASAN